MPNFRTTHMTTNIWIEKGWGDSVENATFDDIKSAIEETIRMDEEHGAFWVGHMENEFVLEVHKNLDLFLFMEKIKTNKFKLSLTIGKT